MKLTPALNPAPASRFDLGGEIRRRLAAVTDQWILPAPSANPAMLEMFRDRDTEPYRDQVPWAGEFAGKWLTHAVQTWVLTREERLRSRIAWFVTELAGLQAEDGYLGPWPRRCRLTGKAPDGGITWDAWGHYHVMLGLLLWHGETGDAEALGCARKIGELFCDRFLGTGARLVSTGSEEKNLAPIHALCLLFGRTGEARYLEMAREIEKDFEVPPAGDYLRTALAGMEFHLTPKPRWESLHPIQGIAELYFITGDDRYRAAFEHIWWSIAKGDRHNNGGFSSGEAAQGDPYHEGAIETCCTVAWLALSVDMLRMTGDPIVADEIELSTLNSGLGLMHPSGRWVAYDTPMEGRRTASQHSIVFQARPGQPELNCCSVNGPRALGMISDWALMADGEGLVLNWYGPGTMAATLPSGNEVTLAQDTGYPLEGQVRLTVRPQRPEAFSLSLRIPHWSGETSVIVNGEAVPDVLPGRYLRLERAWSSGDTIGLDLDFRPHFWVHEIRGRTADWEADWRIFGPIAFPAPSGRPVRGLPPFPGDGLVSMPGTLSADGGVLAAREVRSGEGRIDFGALWERIGEARTAYAFTEVECGAEEALPVSFGSDRWAAWFVNGRKVFDNNGSTDDRFAPAGRSHSLLLRLRAGKNLIAVRVTEGRAGWGLSVGVGERPYGIPRELPEGATAAASVYRGPILLAFDRRFGPTGAPSGGALPVLAAEGLAGTRVEADSWLKPWLLLECPTDRDVPVRLCDFASAGAAGDPYLTWLPVRFGTPAKAGFSRRNPLRSFRPGRVADVAAALSWLEKEARRLIRSSIRTTSSGIHAFFPAAGGHYQAFWLRDYAYMLEGCPEAFTDGETADALRYFAAALREDGAAVDCVKLDGTPCYKPGYGTYGENPVADGSQFLVDVAWHTHRKTGNLELVRRTIGGLERTMRAVPRGPQTGLVHIRPDLDHDRCPYGFTDSVWKTGDCLFESLLYVQACRQLADLEDCVGRADPAVQWRREAEEVSRAVRQVFWDQETGLFLAATVRCGQPDVWGSAFAAYLGVADREQTLRVARYFREHYDGIVRCGQLRHLPAGVFWEKTFSKPGQYQNGAYWGTPIGWFVDCLDLVDPALSDRTVCDMVNDYIAMGDVPEYVCESGVLGAAGNSSSASLPIAGIRRMLARRGL